MISFPISPFLEGIFWYLLVSYLFLVSLTFFWCTEIPWLWTLVWAVSHLLCTWGALSDLRPMFSVLWNVHTLVLWWFLPLYLLSLSGKSIIQKPSSHWFSHFLIFHFPFIYSFDSNFPENFSLLSFKTPIIFKFFNIFLTSKSFIVFWILISKSLILKFRDAVILLTWRVIFIGFRISSVLFTVSSPLSFYLLICFDLFLYYRYSLNVR